MPWYDLKVLSDVIKPGLIQEHPTLSDVFCDNRFA